MRQRFVLRDGLGEASTNAKTFSLDAILANPENNAMAISFAGYESPRDPNTRHTPRLAVCRSGHSALMSEPALCYATPRFAGSGIAWARG